MLVGISGGSASGKSTFAAQLETALCNLKPGSARVLSQDHYYIDQSARFTGDGEGVNFDHPDAIDFALLREHLIALKAGHPIQVPHYDFATHTRAAQTSLYAATPYVLVDGTLILASPLTKNLFDHTVFIEAPEAVRYARRLLRDTTQRGRTREGVERQFTRQVKPMHDTFVEPSKAIARSVISGEVAFDHAVQDTLKVLAARP